MISAFSSYFFGLFLFHCSFLSLFFYFATFILSSLSVYRLISLTCLYPEFTFLDFLLFSSLHTSFNICLFTSLHRFIFFSRLCYHPEFTFVPFMSICTPCYALHNLTLPCTVHRPTFLLFVTSVHPRTGFPSSLSCIHSHVKFHIIFSLCRKRFCNAL